MKRTLAHRARRKLFQQALARLWVHEGHERLVRLGSEYGGWWVPSDLLDHRGHVVCAGVGEDTTFDEALIARGCEVWALDPTPRAIEHVRARGAGMYVGDRFHFLPVGLWHRREQLRFYTPANPDHVSHSIVNLQETSGYFLADCLSLRDVMDRAGFEVLDLLKLDIEGAEFAVLDDMIASPIRPQAICVELDDPLPARRTLDLLRRLRGAGYRLVHSEGWNLLLLIPGTIEG
jgi:FkbM family methyltransferase